MERSYGASFGEPFTPDGDFVNVRGELHSGEAIAVGHQQIFDTIYAGSTVRYSVIRVREIEGGAILAHVRGELDVPGGPLAGKQKALASVLIVGRGDERGIGAFHNTLIA